MNVSSLKNILVIVLALKTIDLTRGRCGPTEFDCEDGDCIPLSKKCDEDPDCSSGVDEDHCPYCRSREFECQDKQCVYKSQRCNGVYNCKDKSDERNCTFFRCAENKYQCLTGQCVADTAHCDGEVDCSDGSDEANCASCSSEAFVCDGVCRNRMLLCNLMADCQDGTDENEISCPNGSVPQIWRLWSATRHSPLRVAENVSLMYVDAHVAVYFDKNIPPSTTWLFSLISKAWNYIQMTYEPRGPNPRLYLILHGSNYMDVDDLSSLTGTRFRHGFRHLIDALASQENSWKKPSIDNVEKLLSDLSYIIRSNALDVLFLSDFSTCRKRLPEIIFYDIYSYSSGQLAPSVVTWRTRRILQPDEDIFCLRDWYLPLYETFDGVQVLARFLNLTFKVQSKLGDFFSNRSLNDGDFIHFWSEAAGTNLEPLAKHTFKWSTELEKQLLEARQYFPPSYAVNSLTFAYINYHVGIYFQNLSRHTSSTYKTISNVWQYARNHYYAYNISDNSANVIILHNNISTPLLNKSCITPRELDPNKTSHFLYVIDCGNYNPAKFETGRNVYLDLVTAQIVEIALDLNHRKATLAVHQVSGTTLTSVFAYDIYLQLHLTDDATRWKGDQLTKSLPFPHIPTYWFRDWYLKIYEGYNETIVLLKFLTILNESLAREGVSLTQQLNLGKFVHFWSGAAGHSLLELADASFGWNQTFQDQFLGARIEFSNLNYSCENCDSFRWKSKYNNELKLPTASPENENAIGIVIATAVAILCIAVAAFGVKFYFDAKKIQNLNSQIKDLTPDELNEFLAGNPNADLTDAHASIFALPFDNAFEVEPDRLVIDPYRVLGSGEFGIVYHGVLKGPSGSKTEKDIDVAVKAVKQNVEISFFKALLSEIKIMIYLGHQENIASILGTVTGNIVHREVYLALEYCTKGDLLHYLRRNRNKFHHLWTPCILEEFQVSQSSDCDTGDSERSRSIRSENLPAHSTRDLVEWSRQIANGMAFIGSKNVIHGDLAARNVLLSFDNVAKISDFGLSRQLANYSAYKKSSKTPLPWRWLAIEAFNDKLYSVHSDVWSFGITLWEIFTLGRVPFSNKCWGRAFVAGLIAGDRPERPEYGNEEIYGLMLACLKKEPIDRISFQEIATKLNALLENLPSNTILSPRTGCAYTAL